MAKDLAPYTPHLVSGTKSRNTILGLGVSDSMTKNFIDVAYEQGMIQSKIFSIAGTSNSLDQDNSTITFGGYRDEDITGDISYYDSFYSANSWSIKMDSFDLSGNENAYYSLRYMPFEIDLTNGKPTIAHFNSSYPFLGVDEETYDEF